MNLLEEGAVLEVSVFIHEGGDLLEIEGQMVAFFMEYRCLKRLQFA